MSKEYDNLRFVVEEFLADLWWVVKQRSELAKHLQVFIRGFRHSILIFDKAEIQLIGLWLLMRFLAGANVAWESLHALFKKRDHF